MIEKPFAPRRDPTCTETLGYILYDVEDMFTEPNECEIVIDFVFGYVEREFGAVLQTTERGDCAFVVLRVNDEEVELVGDWGLGYVLLTSLSKEADAVTEQIALSLQGMVIDRHRTASEQPN